MRGPRESEFGQRRKKKFLTVVVARTRQLRFSSDTSIPCLPSVHTRSLGENFVVIVVVIYVLVFLTRHRKTDKGGWGGGGEGGGRQTDTQRQRR